MPVYASRDMRYDEFGQKRPVLHSSQSGRNKALIIIDKFASCREVGGNIKVKFLCTMIFNQ